MRIRNLIKQLLVVSTLLVQASQVFAATESAIFVKRADIKYAQTTERDLSLDLYMPAGVDRPKLLVYVHGGAWRTGSKESIPTMAYVEQGYALASLDFRLSTEDPFPAQMHDINAGIRFLRGNAHKFGYDAEKIVIIGLSSGGHLVQLKGVTNGHPELEGELGNYRDESSDVQAVVSYFGASNLMTILGQSTPHGLSVRVPALDLFIGGQPQDVEELARLASPVFHVDGNSAPLLMLHGDQDPQMPINQSHELHHAYKLAGVEVHFEVVHGGAHTGPLYSDKERLEVIMAFLAKQLR